MRASRSYSTPIIKRPHEVGDGLRLDNGLIYGLDCGYFRRALKPLCRDREEATELLTQPNALQSRIEVF